MVRPKTEEEIALMRENGILVSKTLAEVGKIANPSGSFPRSGYPLPRRSKPEAPGWRRLLKEKSSHSSSTTSLEIDRNFGGDKVLVDRKFFLLEFAGGIDRLVVDAVLEHAVTDGDVGFGSDADLGACEQEHLVDCLHEGHPDRKAGHADAEPVAFELLVKHLHACLQGNRAPDIGGKAGNDSLGGALEVGILGSLLEGA